MSKFHIIHPTIVMQVSLSHNDVYRFFGGGGACSLSLDASRDNFEILISQEQEGLLVLFLSMYGFLLNIKNRSK